jgi:hypothetical protein
MKTIPPTMAPPNTSSAGFILRHIMMSSTLNATPPVVQPATASFGHAQGSGQQQTN